MNKCFLVDDCQSAFIKGRNVHNLDMLDYHQLIKTESLVFFLDFLKASDMVKHPFLLKALCHLGSGVNFCNVFQFHKTLKACDKHHPQY